jgi:hypothetical protein
MAPPLRSACSALRANALKQSTPQVANAIPELQPIMEIADPEWQSLIRFGLYTGQRLVDLATLTWC